MESAPLLVPLSFWVSFRFRGRFSFETVLSFRFRFSFISALFQSRGELERRTFLGRIRLERGDVASVANPLVHSSIRVATFLRQFVPVLRLRQQLADGALRQTEHVTREQPLPDVVAAQNLAHVLCNVGGVQRHLPVEKKPAHGIIIIGRNLRRLQGVP